MKHILIFALRQDLLRLLEMVESNGSLKYMRMGNFAQNEVDLSVGAFESGSAIPSLGKASADSSAACESYLVCESITPINLRELQGSDGPRICIDQLANMDSVEFKPGGQWNDDVVIHGRIATASETHISQDLMKRFQAAVKKTFSKVRAYYVGRQALELLESGKRLTMSVHSPREYDLAAASVKG